MAKIRAAMSAEEAIEKIKSLYNPANVAGMARYGINSHDTYGVSIPALRKMAKEIGKDHEAALKLWKSGIHEARLLAGFVDDPRQVTEDQIEAWVKDFNSWDICDQVCSNLAFLPIIKTGATDERNFAKKVVNWALRQIGKRNANLNRNAIKAAEEIRKIDAKSARWIASDALGELTSETVARKIMKQ